jgi:pimeloyl-ACP methyl ester carboxylesterase
MSAGAAGTQPGAAATQDACFILIPGAGGSAWVWHRVADRLRQRGHGFTAPLVCERMPVALLVLVNAMIPRPGETPGQWRSDTGYLQAKRLQNCRDGRAEDAPFDARFEFFHDVPQPVIDAAWAQGEPRQSRHVFGSRCDFVRWPAIPKRVLAGRDDRFFPLEFQRRVAQERLGIEVEEMPGGHLLPLSQPEALAERLTA